MIQTNKNIITTEFPPLADYDVRPKRHHLLQTHKLKVTKTLPTSTIPSCTE